MDHGLEMKPSQACATKMLTLTTPQTAVTISIITTSFTLAPRGEERLADPNSQSITGGQHLVSGNASYRSGG
jgi:hypothetical protein